MKKIYLLLIAAQLLLLQSWAQLHVTYTVNTTVQRHAISPYIYGNQNGTYNKTTFRRLGGNRLSAYSWETNYSNEGADGTSTANENDNWLPYSLSLPGGEYLTPGSCITSWQDTSLAWGAQSGITLPMIGWVANDGSGVVTSAQIAPSSRWARVVDRKNRAFTLTPVTTDDTVYVDEEINFIMHNFGASGTTNGVKNYIMDNEPGDWYVQYPHMRSSAPTYSELFTKSTSLSSTIKWMDSNANVIGPELDGFYNMYSLAGASDATSYSDGWFVSSYLKALKHSADSIGARLLNVFTFHWYTPATTTGGASVQSADTSMTTSVVRMQNTRTLWDSSYTEDSWVTNSGYGSYYPLIPRVQSSINTYYPGTSMGITEYDYGGYNHISGTIAQLDAMGIFGNLGLTYCSLFSLNPAGTGIDAHTQQAFNMFLNYDGSNSQFGSTHFYAAASDTNSTIYASGADSLGNTLHTIVTNKNYADTIYVKMVLNGGNNYTAVNGYYLSRYATTIAHVTISTSTISHDTFTYAIPPLSIYHFVFTATTLPVVGAISGSSSLCVGSTTTLTDTTSGGTWSSVYTSVATINSSGVVTGVSAGTDTIKYAVTNSYGTTTVSYVITVNAATSAGTISGTSAVSIGGTTTLTDGVSGGTWSSSNTSLATVNSSGVVTGVSNGSVSISYAVTGTCGTAYATYSVTVSCPAVTGADIITTVAGNGSTGYSGDGGAATSSEMNSPHGVAIDGSGNMYIADFTNQRIRKVSTSGNISTLAGNGTAGYSGDGSAATAAELNSPRGLAVDASGNVYVADAGNNRVRKVNTSGIISTVAGNGTGGYSGDGGAATATEINNPNGVAIDGSGNMYIAEFLNNRIRKVNTSGIISTIAGNGTAGYTGDGAAATAAEIYEPQGIAVDGGGNVYFPDYNNSVIRKVTPSGIISTIAGNGTSGYTGDGGAATALELKGPAGVAVDGIGNIYIADELNQRIRIVNTSGILLTVAGNSTSGYSSDGSAATASELYNPVGVTVDGSGNVYIADAANNRIRKVTDAPAAGSISGISTVTIGNTTTLTDGVTGGTWSSSNSSLATINSSGVVTGVSSGSVVISYTVSGSCGTSYTTYSVTVTCQAVTGADIITTIAGNGTTGYSGDGGAATSAEMNSPHGVAIDGSGNIYIADFTNQRIRKVSTSGIISTVAGNGTGGYSGDGSAATAAELNSPRGLAVDASGNVYIADAGNNRVRKVNTSGIISTVAGNGTAGYSGDGSQATAAEINNPNGVAIDGSGNMYIAEFLSNRIRKVNTSGIISTIAGNGTAGYTGDGGAATAAEIYEPQNVAVDGSGNVYIPDYNSSVIRKVSTSGGITTIAGNGTGGYSGDGGAATSLELNGPVGVAIDVNGNVYIADINNQRIRKVNTSGIITTLTGNGTSGFSGDGGAATAADLYNPVGVAVDGIGNVYIADAANNRIRKINNAPLISTISGTTTVCAGATTTLSDTTGGGTWSSSNTGIATVNSSGVVTGVSAGSATISYTVTNSCGTAVATASVTVNAATSAGTISGTSTVSIGSTTSLSDGISGGTWSSSNTSIATINSSGVVTGVSNGSVSISYAVTGTCGTAYATYSVTVSCPGVSGSSIITTVGGTGTAGISGDGGAATTAKMNGPQAVATDGSGNIYVADFSNNRIRKITSAGIISTIAGNGTAGSIGDGSAATAAEISGPLGVAIDGSGNIYISGNDARIRVINSAGVIRTFAGNGTSGYSGDGGPATAAKVGQVYNMVTDGSNNLYLADQGNNVIRKISTAGIITTLAGNGTSGFSGDGGPATSAELYFPSGVGIDGTGNLYIADVYNNRVRLVNSSGIISTIAGNGTGSFAGDGSSASAAELDFPDDVLVDGSGAIYISDAGNARIRKINTSGIISTVAGTGTAGYGGDGGAASAGNINAPQGITIDGSGNLYIADYGNNRVRKITASMLTVAGISGTTTLCAGNTTTLSDATTGGSWTSSNTSIATVNSSGMVTGVSAGSATISYTVTNSCGTSVAVTSVTVNALPNVNAVSNQTVCNGSNTTAITFTGSIGGTTFTWSNSNTTIGLAASGTGNIATFAGVNTGSSPNIGTITVTPISPSGCTGSSGTFTITVNPAPSAGSISGTTTICTGSATTLTDGTSGGTWTSGSPSIATINSSGVVTGVSAGSVTISYTVTNSCGSASATATVTVNPLPSVGTISGVTTICAGAVTTLTDGTSGGTWSSSASGIASVNSSGHVTGVSAGSATISYTVTNSCGTSVAVTSVTVNALPNVNAVSNQTVCNGSNTTAITFTGSIGGSTFTWANSNTTIGLAASGTGNIATFAGVNTGSSPNIGTITVTPISPSGCTGSSGTFTITVNPAPSAGSITGTTTVCPGSTTTLTDGTSGGTWSSASTSVATINSSGVVTGVSAGSAIISYTVTNSCGSASATATVTVNSLPSAGTISGTSTVTVGSTTSLTDGVSGGTWSSSNTSVATVNSSGVVTGVANGSVTISYAVTGSCGTAYATYSVAVSCPSVTGGDIITTVAGNGVGGFYTFSGDGGQATAAELSGPQGIAVDGSGNLYIADYYNSRIRKVTPSGIITTIAGNGGTGFSGDGGPATAATINDPWAVAVDGSGNVYIADTYNSRIRKVNSSGTITTVAGNGTSGYSGDGGAATAAELSGSVGIAVDASGNLYITDNVNGLIRKINSSGIITTIAGGGTSYPGDGGAATAAELDEPYGVAVDGSGNVYTAEFGSSNIRKVNSSGIISTIAGVGSRSYSGDGGPATAAALAGPIGIAVDGSGNLYIGDEYNSVIRKISSSGIISSIAGNGTNGYAGDGGAATAAYLYSPQGVAVDISGSIYITDVHNNVVRKVTNGPSAGTISGSASLSVGGTTTLTDATSGGTWSSSNTSLATVNSSGVVSGVAAGSVTISYSVTNSCGTAVATQAVTVSGSSSSTCGIITTIAGNGGEGDSGYGGPATAAEIYQTVGVAIDGSGNLYFAVNGDSRVCKVTPAGIISSIAGTGSYGYSGDGGAATAAQLYGPWAVAVDGSGNVYIADSYNNRIRKVTTAGIISTIAGNGTGGYSGDGSAATTAELNYPRGVAIDGSGNVYIADKNNSRIRKVNPAGIISTFAGNGTGSYSGDGGAATAAEINAPEGVAVDGSGNVYIGDYGNFRIRKVTPSGAISTIAGGGSSGLGDGGAATAAELSLVYGVAVDGSGNLFISEGGAARIRKVTSAGIISTIAGNGTGAYSGDGGPATAAELWDPQGVAVDGSGNIYIGDYGNNRIRKVGTCGGTCPLPTVGVISGSSTVSAGSTTTLSDTTTGGTWSSSNTSLATVNSSGVVTGVAAGSVTISYSVTNSCGTSVATQSVTVSGSSSSSCGNIITTIAGNGTPGYSGDGGQATAAEISGPNQVAIDSRGNFYIAGYSDQRIRKVTPSGIISTIAGNGTAGFSGDGGPATAAELNQSWAVAVDGNGNIYITDYGNNRIRKVDTFGIINTFAGTGTGGHSGDGGQATAAQINDPISVEIDGSGNIYIVDNGNACIRKVNTSGVINTIAGSGTPGYSGDGGQATAAKLSNPQDIVVDGAGNLYIADGGNNCIRKVNASGIINTIAGNTTAGFSGDGAAATSGELNLPSGVDVDGSGNLYISDYYNNCIRIVNTSGIINTFAGTGAGGYSGDGGPATAAELYGPTDVKYKSSAIYIADYFNNRIRKISNGSLLSVGTISGTSTICAGSTVTLSDTSSGGTWSSSNPSIATINSSGVVTGVAPGIDTISYTVTNSCGTSSATAVVMVSSGTPSAISGASAICIGSATTMSDAVTGGEWISSNTSVATITTTGVVTGVGAGDATIIYFVDNSCGSGVAYTTINVNSPSVDAISGASGVCMGSSTTLSEATSGGVWSSSNPSVATVNSSGVVSGLASGAAVITYTITNSCGTNYAVATMSVNSSYLAAITGAGSLCPGNSISLTDATSGGIWTSGNTSVATVSSSGVVTGVSPGTADIGYTIVNSCGTFVVYGVVTVNAAPSVAAISGAGTVCSGASITLSDATSGGTWSSGTTSIATVNSSTGVVTGVSAGIDTIYYNVTNSCGTTIVSWPVTVNPYPGVITGMASICVGSATTLSDVVAGGSWSSASTAVATINASGAVSGVSAGSATIKYTVTNSCGTSFSSFALTVVSPSVAAITGGASSICPGSTTTLADATTGSSSSWSSSNTARATVNTSGVVTGVSPGSDTITYTVTNACGTYSAIKSISMTSPTIPAAIAGSGSALCPGATTTFTDGTGGGVWSSTNNAIATVSSSGVVTGVGVGADTIKYSYTNSCGQVGTVTKLVTVNPATVSAISGPSNLCMASTITLSDSTAGGVWSSTSTGVATVSAGGVVSGASAGSATISYTLTSACGTIAASYMITVIAPGAIAAISGGTSSLCPGATTTLSDATTGTSMTWSSSNTAISTVNSSTGVVTGVGTGTDTITYTITNACGTYSAIKSISVTGPTVPGAISGAGGALCPGATTTFSDGTGGGVWSSTNNAIATVSSSGVVTGVGVGIDTIKYSYTNSCGQVGTVTKLVTVSPATVSAITGTSSLCTATSITLSDSTAGGVWSSSSTGIATVSSAGIVYGVSAGSTTIDYTLTSACGAVASSFTVTVIAPGSIAAISGGTSAICPGATTTLSDATTSSSMSWSSSNSAVNTINSSTGVVTGVGPGTDTITYTVTNACGTYTAIKPISVTGPTTPGAIAGSSAAICPGATVSFSDGTAGGVWSSANNSVATVSTSGVVTGVAGGTDTILYSITNSCGQVGSSLKTVSVNPSTVSSITGPNNVCTASSITLSDATSGGAWSSTSTTVATVSSSGVVHGSVAGSTTIKFTLTSSCGTISASLNVTVSAPGAISPITGGSSTLCPGATMTLADATTGSSYSWSSSNTAKATVDAVTGVVTGVFGGNDTIKYTVTNACGTVSTTKAFSVIGTTTPGGISGATSVHPGSTITLGDGTSGGTWSSSNTALATVNSSGVVYGISGGADTIKYSITNSCGAVGYALKAITVLASRPDIGGTVNISEEGSVSIFPNPANGSLNMEWTGDAVGTARIVITDMLGKNVYGGNWDLAATSGKTNVDVSGLVSGTYIITIQSETIRYSGRFVVEK